MRWTLQPFPPFNEHMRYFVNYIVIAIDYTEIQIQMKWKTAV